MTRCRVQSLVRRLALAAWIPFLAFFGFGVGVLLWLVGPRLAGRG